MRKIFYLLALLCTPFTLSAELVDQEVEYKSGGQLYKGFLVYDNAVKGKRPGVLVVHEWWGHNAYARKRARMLAALGYTALALDMYGDGKQADHPKEAGKFAAAVKQNMADAEARFEAANSLLQAHETVAAEDISAIGYCFGGGVVLEMARRGVDLDAVASFHGSLGTDSPATSGAIKGRVLVYNGAADPFVKPEQVTAFKSEMEQAGVDYLFMNLEGAKHSFTNPDADEYGKRFNLPLAYDQAADEASWASMSKVLKEIYDR